MPEPRQPTLRTLKKYGMTVEDWERILKRQGWACAICGNVPPSGVLHIDHDHQRGWAKKPPEERKKAVRGVICWFDNNFLLRRGATPQRLRAAARYLELYERRKK